MPESTIQVTVNGVQRSVDSGKSVADLLAELQQNPKYLAVERNKILVPRSQHATCQLTEGDAIEIVTLVGGG